MTQTEMNVYIAVASSATVVGLWAPQAFFRPDSRWAPYRPLTLLKKLSVAAVVLAVGPLLGDPAQSWERKQRRAWREQKQRAVWVRTS